MFKRYAHEAQFALHAVRKASRLASEIQHQEGSAAIEKADRSPVTVADFASQAVIARLFEETFPNDRLIAEEGSTYLSQPSQRDTLRKVTEYVSRLHPGATEAAVCRWIDRGQGHPAARFWCLDPIDGTKGFLRGDQYVVALALIEQGRVVLGALGCPNLNAQLRPDIGGPGCVLLAVTGQGTWVTPLSEERFTQLRVSPQQDPKQIRLLRSVEQSHTDERKMARLLAALGTEQPAVLMDSQAKYAVLAAGNAELIARLIPPSDPHYSEHIWDQAAGSILVEEAGGRVTDLTGKPLDFSAGRKLDNNLGVASSNAHLHPAVLDAIHAAGADRRPEAA